MARVPRVRNGVRHAGRRQPLLPVMSVRVRVIGLPDEVTAAVTRLGAVFGLVETSKPLPCRGTSRNVRIYLKVRTPRDADACKQ